MEEKGKKKNSTKWTTQVGAWHEFCYGKTKMRKRKRKRERGREKKVKNI